MGPRIQDDLARRDLLPGVHLLDGGYVDADLLVTAQSTHQIEVVGPPSDPIASSVGRETGMT